MANLSRKSKKVPPDSICPYGKCGWNISWSCFEKCHCIVYSGIDDPKKYLKEKYKKAGEWMFGGNREQKPEGTERKPTVKLRAELWETAMRALFERRYRVNIDAPIDQDILDAYKRRGLMSSLGFLV